MSQRVIRMLFLPRESFPTFRPDVDILFGRQLIQRGHAIDFIMQAANSSVPTGPQQWNRRTVWIGRTDTGRGFWHRFRKHWRGIWHDLTSLRHARRERYDALQVKDKFLVAIVAIAVARRRGLRFFFWLSFPFPESEIAAAADGLARYPAFARMRGMISGWLLYRWIIPRCDHLFVQSARMKEDVCARGADPVKVYAVPMGVDAADFPPNSPGEARAPRHMVRLAYLGTLGAERRLEILVDTLAELQRMGLDATLQLVGDGDRPDDRLRLERRAAQLGVADRLQITGFLPRSEAIAHIRCADVCLSPFYPSPILLSTSPTKLVEYLALGMPVVANHHPEQRMVLRETRAGVCVPWGARHFARGIQWLMRRTESERAAMAERGRAWVQTHRTYDRIADDLEARYLELLSGAQSR